MIRAEVTTDAVEVMLSRGDAILLGVSALLTGVLLVLGGWQVAFVALGLSTLGAGAVGLVERSDLQILGH